MRFSVPTLVLALGGLDAVLARALPESSLVVSTLEARAPAGPVRLTPNKPKPDEKPDADDDGPGAPVNAKPIGSPRIGSSRSYSVSGIDEKVWDQLLDRGKKIDKAIKARENNPGQEDRKGFPSLRGTKDKENPDYRVTDGPSERLSDEYPYDQIATDLGLKKEANFDTLTVTNREWANGGKPQALLEVRISKEEGTIFADVKFSKSYDKTPDEGNRRITQSNMMYQLIEGRVKNVIQAEIVNFETMYTIDAAYNLLGLDRRKPAVFAPAKIDPNDGADEVDKKKKMNDSFHALMGTQNAYPTGYMVADHWEKVGPGSIKAIRIYPGDPKNYDPDYMAIQIGT